MLKDDFGVEDGWPVFCEPFKQWVLEDNFPLGRPALEKVGVQFVADVSPFELMKIRILNGGHATIAYPAGLMDIHFVHEAMQNPLVRGFLDEAGAARRSCRPCRRCRVPFSEEYFKLIEQALLQPQDRRHRPPALPRWLQPPAEIHPPDHRRPAEGGPGRSPAWRWNRRCGAATASAPATAEQIIEPNDPNWERLTGGVERGEIRSGGVAGDGGHLRRGRQVGGVCGGVWSCAECAMEGWDRGGVEEVCGVTLGSRRRTTPICDPVAGTVTLEWWPEGRAQTRSRVGTPGVNSAWPQPSPYRENRRRNR